MKALAARVRTRSVTEDRGYLTPCRTWTGNLNIQGYGYVYVSRKLGLSVPCERLRVHRVVWEHQNGPIPPELVIDHLCRNRACTELSHMELVTRGENVLRGISPTALNRRKTHCIHGHEFDEVNTYIRRDTGTRQCLTCCRSRAKALRARRSA